MRKTMLLFIFIILFWAFQLTGKALGKDKPYTPANKTQNVEDNWLGWDKAGHFLISGFLAGSSYSIYHQSFNNDKVSSIYFSSIFTLSLGVGKEINDMKKPKDKFSYKDIIFDVLGTSAGILIASQ